MADLSLKELSTERTALLMESGDIQGNGEGKPHGHSHGHGHDHGDGHKKKKKKKKGGHGHDHGHEHGGHDEDHHGHGAEKEAKSAADRKARRALIGATVFTFLFMIVEIVGGWFAGSLAIMTDAAHLLTDVAAMLLSLFAMFLARRPANETMTFGYHRAEILGALASVVTIWALVAILCYEAILRLISDAHLVGDTVDGRIMTIVGSAGLLVNIIDAFILHWGNAPHGHSHAHGQGHAHGHHGNVNVRAAFLHVVGDCLQSIGVIAASLIIWIGNQVEFGSPKAKKSLWNLADPIASLLFGVITLATTVSICKKIVDVLMERVPEEIDYEVVKRDLESIQGVSQVHDLHIWSLSLGKVSLSVHLNAEDHVGALVAARKVCMNHGISHTTIQVDPADYDDDCIHNLH